MRPGRLSTAVMIFGHQSTPPRLVISSDTENPCHRARFPSNASGMAGGHGRSRPRASAPPQTSRKLVHATGHPPRRSPPAGLSSPAQRHQVHTFVGILLPKLAHLRHLSTDSCNSSLQRPWPDPPKRAFVPFRPEYRLTWAPSWSYPEHVCRWFRSRTSRAPLTFLIPPSRGPFATAPW